MTFMNWKDLKASMGKPDAKKELVRQLRMFADQLETDSFPDVFDCKIQPGATLNSDILTTIEVTVSHTWPG